MHAHTLCDDLQSVYRPGHSVETTLLKMKNDMDMAVDWGDGILVVLLDLSEAFDTVDHHILMDKLKYVWHNWQGSPVAGFIPWWQNTIG